MFSSVLVCVAVVMLFWMAGLRLRMRSHEFVRRECWGPLRVELRRRTEMSCHADGLGGRSYPAPIETRSLTLVLFELALWVRCESIGLPAGAECRLEQISSGDYDRHFTAAFSAVVRGRSACRAFHLPA